MQKKITGHRLALALMLLIVSLPTMANEGIDARINETIKPFADAVAGFIFFSFPVAGVQIPFVLG